VNALFRGALRARAIVLCGALGAFAIAVSASSDLNASQKRSTRCHVAPVSVWSGQTDQQLVACGGEHPANTLWHLDRADSVDGTLDGLHAQKASGRGVVVYVLDSGVRRDHVEFTRPAGSTVIDGIEIGGWESFTAGRCPNPSLEPCAASAGLGVTLSHGTAVASIIGGARAGLAPDVRIVSLRVALEEENWLRALEAVIDHAFSPTTPLFRTAIINISGGLSSGGTRFAELITRMTRGVNELGEADEHGKRFLFVAAAGNADAGQCAARGEVAIVPALYGREIPGLITVGGLSRSNRFWSGSCGGPAVEMLAPAEDIVAASSAGIDHYQLDPDWIRSGTSYAAPYVAGVAARLLELHPDLTPAALEERLAASPSRVAGLPVPIQ
jgi:aqualysin 1